MLAAPGEGAGVRVLGWRVPGRWQQSSVLQRQLKEAGAAAALSALAACERSGAGAGGAGGCRNGWVCLGKG